MKKYRRSYITIPQDKIEFMLWCESKFLLYFSDNRITKYKTYIPEQFVRHILQLKNYKRLDKYLK